MTRLAINGFGRIGGRNFNRAYLEPEPEPGFEVAALNDLGEPDPLVDLVERSL
jgi:glyceraldehyde-3-phosphate dehydrogenase/erythrose-4-phosphate dehydrogenase